MEGLKKILTITPIEDKNIVKINTSWVYENIDDPDDDSCVCQNSFNADDFFKDKELIWSLAYLEKYVAGDSKYIDFEKLNWELTVRYNLWPYFKEDETCSLEELEITYYDENVNPFKVTFDNIHKRWENMTEEEICKEVNDVLRN